jgi:hypothetical protein
MTTTAYFVTRRSHFSTGRSALTPALPAKQGEGVVYHLPSEYGLRAPACRKFSAGNRAPNPRSLAFP